MKLFGSLLVLALALGVARAEVTTMDIDYEHDGVKLRGYLAYDVASNDIRPGVLVFPEWWGLNDYAKQRARELAELGYIAFACDMYGAGVETDSWEEAPKLSGPFYEDRELMRVRAQAGLQTLKNHTLCDKTKLAAIGYCFGGTCALELARSGAELNGVVTFHGGLSTPNTDNAKNIKCKVLVCTGGADTFVPDTDLVGFMNEMRAADVLWELDVYSGARHAFTNPAHQESEDLPVAYNEIADKRSWERMKDFFNELFKQEK